MHGTLPAEPPRRQLMHGTLPAVHVYNVCVACTTVMFTRTSLVLILEEERSWCTQLLSSELQSVPSAR